MTCRHLIAQGAFSKFLHFLVGPNAENVSWKLMLMLLGTPTWGYTRGYGAIGGGCISCACRGFGGTLEYWGIGWEGKGGIGMGLNSGITSPKHRFLL